jgi:hypothetical protein
MKLLPQIISRMLEFGTDIFQSAVSWLGHNSFPYFETTRPNSIDQARENFYAAVGQTEGVSGGKPVWVTETGWPRSKLSHIQLRYIIVNFFIQLGPTLALPLPRSRTRSVTGTRSAVRSLGLATRSGTH